MIGIDTNHVQKHLLQDIRVLLDKTGQKYPPFKPELIAPYRKVVEIRREKLKVPGILIPIKEGFVIKLNADDPPARQRVTYAHEIVHTFFYDTAVSPPSKVSHEAGQFGHEEKICNYLAGELLMPEEAARKVMAQFDYPSMKAFVTLMNLFNVSSEFLAWRLGILKAWRAIIILFAQRDSPSHRGPPSLRKEALAPLDGKPLRVWKTFKHGDYWRVRIQPGLPIGEKLSPAIAFRSGVEVVMKEYWELGQLKGDFLIQSRRFEGRPTHVVSIVLSDDKYDDFLLSKVPQQTQLSLL